MTQPILFVDIDGVLNSERFFAKQSKRGITIFHDNAHLFDPDAVALLNRIITATNCLVVVSSSWRVFWSLEDILRWMRQAGYAGQIHGKTPVIDGGDRRHLEIERWLYLNDAQETPHVAIDDDPGPPGNVQWVVTTYAEGLTAAKAAEAVGFLLKGPGEASRISSKRPR